MTTPPGKLSKASVRYRSSQLPGIACGTCVMFHPASGTCDIVAGQISPSAVCDRWEPKAVSGNAREQVALTAAMTVGAIFAAAEAMILAELAELVAKVVTGALLVAVAARRLRRIVIAVIAEAEREARPALAQAAKDARSSAEDVIRSDLAGLPASLVARSIAEALSSQPPREWRNLPLLLHQAGLVALRESDDVFRRVVADVTRNVTSAGTETPKTSRLQAAQKALDELARQGITGFTGRAGRRWDLAAYVEMATRTATSRMHLMLQLAAMGPPGFDLVIVTHPALVPICEHCLPYDGRVLSISGKTTGQVSATDAAGVTHTVTVKASVADAIAHGWQHPSCRCSLIPFTDGAGFMPLAGSVQGYMDHGYHRHETVPPPDAVRRYQAEQRLRAMERSLRRERRFLAVAATPQARGKARRRITALNGRLEHHVTAHGLLRNRSREKVGRPR